MNANETIQITDKSLTPRRREGLSESLVFVSCFVALLPVALVASLVGWRWQPWPPGANGYRTFVGEAKTVASSLTATAFSV